MFEHYVGTDFEDILKAIREKANYLKGYDRWLPKKVVDEEALAEGMEYVRQFTNLRQSINEQAQKIEFWEKKRRVAYQKGKEWTPDDQQQMDSTIAKAKATIIGKAWLIENLEVEFTDTYLFENDLEPRNKYNKEVKDDDETY